MGKFAFMVYALARLANNSDLANVGLDKLKRAFSVFVENRQRYPLVYDTVWKVSFSVDITANPS